MFIPFKNCNVITSQVLKMRQIKYQTMTFILYNIIDVAKRKLFKYR